MPTFVCLIVIILWGSVGNLGSSASAAEFPWLDPANTQVILVRDPRVDFALRVEAIERARYTIDSVTYVQSSRDEVGRAVLQAFRRAQDRGVRGRYLIERVGSFLEDTWNKTRKFLTDSNLRRPGELIVFGGLRNMLAGLNIADMVHEKILIIDAGTPYETIFIGGRNNSNLSMTNLDFAVVIRRLKPGTIYLGDQVRNAFNDTWEAAKKLSPVLTPADWSGKLSSQDLTPQSISLEREEQQKKFEELNAALARPVDRDKPLLADEHRPAKMRVLTNEFLQWISTGVFGKSADERMAMPNDILENIAKAVSGAKKVHISMMSVLLHPDLLAAMKAALRNGAEVTLITNSREAHSTHVMWGVPFDMGLAQVLELMDVPGGRLSVYLLDETLLSKLEAGIAGHRIVKYMHRKLLIADDHVFSGSDNFNLNSHVRNSEIVIQGQDADFAAKMRALVGDDLRIFREFSCEDALRESKLYGFLRRGVNRIFMPLY